MKAILVNDVNDPYAGTIPGGSEVDVEGLWQEVSGSTWAVSADRGNPAAWNYGKRVGSHGLPLDNDVLYGKIGGLGFLLHRSELEFTD